MRPQALQRSASRWHLFTLVPGQFVVLCGGMVLSTLGLVDPRAFAAENILSPSTLESITAKALGYRVDHWNIEDGIPTDWVTSIAQTPDGYIWCGTHRGMARFDGVRFERYDQNTDTGLDTFAIQDLLVDRSGRLWMRDATGQLGWWEEGRVHLANSRNGFPADKWGKPALGPDGSVWVRAVSLNAFLRLENDAMAAKISPQSVDVSRVDVFLPLNDKEVLLVMENEERALIRAGNDRPPLRVRIPGIPEDTKFGRLFRLPNGSIGVTSPYGLCFMTQTGWKVSQPGDWFLTTAPLDGQITEDGVRWMGTYDRELIVAGPGSSLRRLRLEGSDENFVVTIFRDPEDSLWMGKPNGLFRLRKTVFQQIPAFEGFGGKHRISSMASLTDGNPESATIWCLWAGRLYQRERGTQSVEAVTVPKSEPDQDPFVVMTTRSNRSVVVAAESGAVFAGGPGGFVKLAELGARPSSMLEQRDGTFWIGSDRNIHRWGGSEFMPELEEDLDHPASDMVEDRNGTVYFIEEGVVHSLWGAPFRGLPHPVEFRPVPAGAIVVFRREQHGLGGGLAESAPISWRPMDRPGEAAPGIVDQSAQDDV